MASFMIFSYFALVPLCYAAVIRNGIKLVAVPIPGTAYKNGSIIVNTRSEQNNVGGDQVQEVHTVTVKTPAATLTFSNASQYQKSIAEQVSSSLGGISASHLDPSELIELDVPVRVNDLLELAKSTSPTKFREKIRSSRLMEKLIDTLQQKSVELYTLKNELEASGHKIVKRESTWNAPGVPDGVWKPLVYEVRWLAPELQNGRWWPAVEPILSPTPETNDFSRSNLEKAAHLPIHHLHLLHGAHLPHHRPVLHRPHLTLLSLLRAEALPIIRLPLALLHFILTRPVKPALSTSQSMMDPLPPIIAGLERLHRGPQQQPYYSLANHDQELSAQLPQRLPDVNLPLNLEYYGGISEQTYPEADQILASNYQSSGVTF